MVRVAPARRSRFVSLAFVSLALSGCGGCDAEQDGLSARNERLWGREKLAADLQAQARSPIDAESLAADSRAFERVRSMAFQEVVARVGFVRYQGTARFKLSRGGPAVNVFEDTLIEHGLHGGWRVLQKDEKGAVLREKVFSNGLYYVRNGPGALRLQGVADAPGGLTLAEAFEPLRAFTAWYGPRLGVERAGSDLVAGRPAIAYRLGLAAGPDLVEDPKRPGKRLRPTELSGRLLVDAETAAPLSAKLSGVLEIEPPPKGDRWGRLELALDFEIAATEGAPIVVREHVPPIAHRESDLDPLGFLEGKSRTSTVIGGSAGSGR